MRKIETYGIVRDSKIHYTKKDEFLKLVYNEFKEGDRFRVVYERLYKKRSNQQNRYYWGCVLPILLTEINEQGNNLSTDDLHFLLKERFCPKKEIHTKEGEVLEVIGSTTILTTTQMCEYVEEVKNWAFEFWSCYIPAPNEQTKADI